MAMRREPTGGESQIESWPLVGRDDELELASAALARGNSAVLTGAAGVGKTRLARSVLERAARDGDHVEWIAATDAASRIPFGALAHMLSDDLSASSSEAPLHRAVVAFERRAGGARVLMGVDDAHLLDPASAALIHAVATSGVALLVVTVRSGEPVLDPITALWKDGNAPLIALQTLARDEVQWLVAAVLGGPVDGAAIELLWRASEGNALFLRELVYLGIETGALRAERGLWRWHGRMQPGERLAQLVARRIGQLAPAEHAALELIAVGEPLTHACVRALGIAAATEQLAQRGVVTSDRELDRGIRLGHPLFGEVVRSSVPALRLDHLRAQLADAVESERRADDERNRFQVALWRAQSGDVSRPDELRWAARHALFLWDGPTAELLARAALRSGADLEAAYLFAEAMRSQKRGEEAAAAFAATEAFDGSESLRAQVAYGWSSILTQLLDRRDEARAMLWRTLQRLAEPGPRQRVIGTLLSDGLASVAEVADELRDDAFSPTTAFGLALESLRRGRSTDALERVDAALATESAWGSELRSMSVLLRLIRIWTLATAGAPLDAEALTDELYVEAVQARTDYPRGAWCLARGMVAVLRGTAQEAARSLLEGDAALEVLDPNLLRPMNAYLAMAYAAMPACVDAAEEALAAAQRQSQVLDHVFGPEVERAAAWVRAARGDLVGARRLALSAATMHRERSAFVLEALARYDAARFGAAETVCERLVEIAARCDSALLAPIADHVRALVAGDPEMLLGVARRFAASGLTLFAAEAAAAAARGYRGQGRRSSALSASTMATSLAATCGPVSTPALALSATEEELTAREREVAVLAATGLPSRDIAERLAISPRTVDNLLGRVYVKFGVHGRQALADLFAPEASPPSR